MSENHNQLKLNMKDESMTMQEFLNLNDFASLKKSSTFDDEECLKPLPELKAVTFQSGPMGFAAKWHTGVVIDVRHESQAWESGIRPGWQMVSVNTLPYSEVLLDKLRQSGKSYEILFAVDAVKECCLKHWTGTTISCPWCGKSFEQAVHHVNRAEWTVGSRVSVYSEGEDAWFCGTITGEKDGRLWVEYTVLFGSQSQTQRRKLLPRDSPDLKPAATRQIQHEASSFAEFSEGISDRQRELSLFQELSEASQQRNLSLNLEVQLRRLSVEPSSFSEFCEPGPVPF